LRQEVKKEKEKKREDMRQTEIKKMRQDKMRQGGKRECRYAAKLLILWQHHCTITYRANKAH